MSEVENVSLEIQELSTKSSDTIAILRLNRADAANAFNSEMMVELTRHLQQITGSENCRALILTSRGKHFSAGADLGWMKEASTLSFEENIEDATKLTTLFEALANLDLPTICMIKGAAYGGALGLIACCDITIAAEDARFCLSEVKLGLLPAVIYPYLGRRMNQGQLRRLSMSGQVFNASLAKEAGLVDITASKQTLNKVLRDELNQVLSGGRQAQSQLKRLHNELRENNFRQSKLTHQAIATARTGQEGQAGLKAFFSKIRAPWVASLNDDWTLDCE